jgi:hypothetical protein
MSNEETDIMRRILVALSELPNSLWWRQNTGVFRSFNGREVIRCGIPGMADIGGMLRGLAVQIEVKTPLGRLSLEQKRWSAAVERAGGIFLCCRDPTDALQALAAQIDANLVEPPTLSTNPGAVNSGAGNRGAVR